LKTRTRIILSGAGAAVFALLIYQIGPAELAANLVASGWVLLPALALHAVVYTANAAAWQVMLASEPDPPAFSRTWAVTVAGFAINFVTPVVSAGGEPWRIAALAPQLGIRRASGTVIMYTMLHAASSVLLWITALLLGFVLLPPTLPVRFALAAALAIVVALGLLLRHAHRHGGLQTLLDLLYRAPLLRRTAPKLERYREALADVDSQITGFYKSRRRSFLVALAIDYASRVVSAAELTLIAWAAGASLGFLPALVALGLWALVINAMFFIPFELGTREGSLYFAFSLLGLDPALGFSVAIVTRLRELLWVAAGLGLIAGTGGGAAAPGGRGAGESSGQAE
jgi:uncharacterized protein (TIRG00374 family)